MKRILLTFSVALTAALLASCGGAKAGKPYPLEVCLVTGEKLGSMGKPYVLVHEGQEIKFCCKGCLPDFNKEPAKFLAKLAALAALPAIPGAPAAK